MEVKCGGAHGQGGGEDDGGIDLGTDVHCSVGRGAVASYEFFVAVIVVDLILEQCSGEEREVAFQRIFRVDIFGGFVLILCRVLMQGVI